MELSRVEYAACVVADDAVEDDEDTYLVEPIAQETERFTPAAPLLRPACIQTQRGAHGRGDFDVAVGLAVGADEGLRVFFVFDEFVAHPGLAALHLVDGVEQIGAGTLGRCAAWGAEVAYRQRFVGRVAEVEVAERRVGPGCESVGPGDADLAGLFPLQHAFRIDIHLVGQLFGREAGPLARPAQHVRLEYDLASSAHGSG